MRRSRAQLVSELVSELRPVRPAPAAWLLAAAWWLGSGLFVALATLASGPLRPGVAGQVAGEPRFLLELLLGLLAGAAAIHAAAHLAIPSPRPVLRRVGPALILLVGWAGATVYGLYDPALEPTRIGKRAHCALQTLLFAGPPLLAGLLLVRRAAPLARVWTGALLGAAAAALPALLMQLACIYDPAHVLAYHLGPGAVAVVVGALLGPLALRRL